MRRFCFLKMLRCYYVSDTQCIVGTVHLNRTSTSGGHGFESERFQFFLSEAHLHRAQKITLSPDGEKNQVSVNTLAIATVNKLFLNYWLLLTSAWTSNIITEGFQTKITGSKLSSGCRKFQLTARIVGWYGKPQPLSVNCCKYRAAKWSQNEFSSHVNDWVRKALQIFISVGRA